MATTIKVPAELRDRLAERARKEHTTLAGAIEHTLNVAEAAAFWDEVRATMGTDEAQRAIDRDAETMSGASSDGLEPEDWSDIL